MCILMCFFKLIKGHLLVSELYIHQNARCNNKKKKKENLMSGNIFSEKHCILLVHVLSSFSSVM